MPGWVCVFAIKMLSITKIQYMKSISHVSTFKKAAY